MSTELISSQELLKYKEIIPFLAEIIISKDLKIDFDKSTTVNLTKTNATFLDGTTGFVELANNLINEYNASIRDIQVTNEDAANKLLVNTALQNFLNAIKGQGTIILKQNNSFTTIVSQLEQRKSQLDVAKSQLEELNKRLVQTQKDLEDARDANDDCQADSRALENANIEIDSNKKQIEALTNQVATLTTELTKLEDEKEELLKDLDSCVSKVNPNADIIQSNTKTIEQYSQQVTVLRNKITETQNELGMRQQEDKEQKKELLSLNGNKKELEKQLREAQKSARREEEDKKNLRNKLESKIAEIEDLDEKISTLETQLASLTRDFQEGDAKIFDLTNGTDSNQSKQIEVLQKQVEELEQENAKLKDCCDDCKDMLEDMQLQQDEYEETIADLKQANDENDEIIEKYEEEIEEKEQEIEDLDEKIEVISRTPKRSKDRENAWTWVQTIKGKCEDILCEKTDIIESVTYTREATGKLEVKVNNKNRDIKNLFLSFQDDDGKDLPTVYKFTVNDKEEDLPNKLDYITATVTPYTETDVIFAGADFAIKLDTREFNPLYSGIVTVGRINKDKKEKARQSIPVVIENWVVPGDEGKPKTPFKRGTGDTTERRFVDLTKSVSADRKRISFSFQTPRIAGDIKVQDFGFEITGTKSEKSIFCKTSNLVSEAGIQDPINESVKITVNIFAYNQDRGNLETTQVESDPVFYDNEKDLTLNVYLCKSSTPATIFDRSYGVLLKAETTDNKIFQTTFDIDASSDTLDASTASNDLIDFKLSNEKGQISGSGTLNDPNDLKLF